MAPFPLIKLGYLAAKQVSKPIANWVKRRAKSHPFFRTWICMPPAQFYNWWEVNFRLRMMGLGKAKNVEPLSEKEAIELGGEMVGEFIVFALAAGILLSEYSRSSRKEAAKEEKLEASLKSLNIRVEEMKTVTEIQRSQIRDLQHTLDSFKGVKPSKANHEGETGTENKSYIKKIFGSKE